MVSCFEGTVNAGRCIFPDERIFHHKRLNSNSPIQPAKVYTLSQVTRSIRLALERATANKSWLVRAEIVQLTGTLGKQIVYVDLVEEHSGRKNAKMRGIIWPGVGQAILEELGADTEHILKPGSEVVFSARIQFHEVHGMALHIDKIELQYMLGELERRKQLTIAQLKEGGALEMNRRIPMAALPQRVALVGSKGTSGYRDFVTKCLGHPRHFRLHIEAFQSSVQGVSAAEELVSALRAAEASQPDLIVLVRGGGGKLDLDAYNDLDVCWTIARSGVPVWTGIGHESDTVVADLVAHRAWKTPTDVAVAILDRFETASIEMETLLWNLEKRVSGWMRLRTHELAQHAHTLKWSGKHIIARHRASLNSAAQLLRIQSPALVKRQHQLLAECQRRIQQSSLHTLAQSNVELTHLRRRLERAWSSEISVRKTLLRHYARTLNTLGPDQTLKRGFMILERDGKVLTRIEGIKPGEQLELRAHDGRLQIQAGNATSSSDPT